MMLSADSNARILNGLRLAAIAGQMIAVTVAWLIFGERLPLWPLLGVTLTYAAWHLAGLRRRHGGVLLDEHRFMVEMLVDVAVITALVGLAGGWTNPFVSIYLVPVGVAAAVLSVPHALLVALAAFGAYVLTMFLHLPLPRPGGALDGFSLHLFGMWVSFVLAGVVLVVTVLLVRRAYDEERRALARERESRLRDEQLLSLGVLAASTAHELGTPLSTARVLVESMQEEGAAPPEDLKLLSEHLHRATHTLHRLVRVAERHDDQEMALFGFLDQIAEKFRTLRPDVTLRHTPDGANGVHIRGNRLLESALLSLLVNAATASAAAHRPTVEFRGRLEGDILWLHIRDYGHGMPARDQRRGNGEGLGVGLAISSATIERYHGEARHYARDPGTEVVVSLPVRALRQQP